MPADARQDDQAPIESRLRARRAELEQAALARVRAIADPAIAPDPAYVAGLRAALAAGLDYGLTAIAEPQREPGPVPVALLSQSRLAARNGVGLQAVLRRYSAGHTLLADTLLDEAAATEIGTSELKAALRSLAVHYDRIVAAVSEEYERESSVTSAHDPARRRVELLRRLLAGELLDTGNLGYELEAHHLAILASGPKLQRVLAALASRLDRRLLLARPDDGTLWAWFGGSRRFRDEELDFLMSFDWPADACIASGEAAHGRAGWRLSHQQAAAAHQVARRQRDPWVRYADVSLLASALQDDLLLDSLRRAYLGPLELERDGGCTAKQTLRAYFAAANNISAAAAALGINRRTVASRLLAIEKRLCRPIHADRVEIELALRLDEIDACV